MKNTPSKMIRINRKAIGLEYPTYFIADIAANHDGNLGRAKELIYLASEAGADAVKFQHFEAKTIVSDYGFKNLGGKFSHQSKWKKSVFQVYNDASLNLNWTKTLKETCDKAGIAFLTSPYSLELVDYVDKYVAAFKVGSGDITWLETIRYMGSKNKPLLLATGAADFDEVAKAVDTALKETAKVILMQCNTNYTLSSENFNFINLNVLKRYAKMYPGMILGLSDHTPGCATVLGAIALGARVIEKHFTDNTKREGPDHSFSMDPKVWKEMMERSRELERALGDGIKRVEPNEKETVVLQRRSIRTVLALKAGSVIQNEHLIFLRPCPKNGIAPSDIKKLIGKKIVRDLTAGEHIKWNDLM